MQTQHKKALSNTMNLLLRQCELEHHCAAPPFHLLNCNMFITTSRCQTQGYTMLYVDTTTEDGISYAKPLYQNGILLKKNTKKHTAQGQI